MGGTSGEQILPGIAAGEERVKLLHGSCGCGYPAKRTGG